MKTQTLTTVMIIVLTMTLALNLVSLAKDANLTSKKFDTLPTLSDQQAQIYFSDGKIWQREAGEARFNNVPFSNPKQTTAVGEPKVAKQVGENQTLVRSEDPEARKNDPTRKSSKGSNEKSVQSHSCLWSEDFEDGFPDVFWQAGDLNPVNGMDYWDDYWTSQGSRRVYSGEASLYCADISDVYGDLYDNHMDAYFKSGAIYVGNYTNIRFNFHVWYDTEAYYDSLKLYLSPDGINWTLNYAWTGSSNGWLDYQFSLYGFTQVYIMFKFSSDYSVTREGTYVDALSIWGEPLQPPAAITVDSPNGGEMWNSPGLRDICWHSSNTSGLLTIEYSSDAGANWNLIATQVPDNGAFPWYIPAGLSSTQCKIRISDANAAQVYDESDGYFSIQFASNRLEIVKSFATPGTSPHGIAWDGNYLWHTDTDRQKIYCLDTNGKLVRQINYYGTKPSGLSWMPPYSLWVSDYRDDMIYQVNAYSGMIISQFSTVHGVNWGVEWDGSTLWTSDFNWAELNQLNVYGNLLRTIPVAAKEMLGIAYDGQYLWTTCYRNDRIYKIDPVSGQILEEFDPPAPNCGDLAWVNGYLWTCSSVTNMIYQLQVTRPNLIQVQAPANGQIFDSPGTGEIRWTSTQPNNPIYIWYSVDAGQNWLPITLGPTANTGVYQWQIPAGINTDRGMICVQDYYHPSYYGYSSGYFTVRPRPDVLTVVHSFPALGTQPTGLAWDGGFIWQADQDSKTIYRLTNDGSINWQIRYQGGKVADLTWYANKLYASDYTYDKIYQLSTYSGQILSSIDTPGGVNWGIEWDGNSFWASDLSRNLLYQLNSKGTILRTLPAPSTNTHGIAYDGINLWVISGTDYRIYKLNPANGLVLSSYDAPAAECKGLAWDGQYLWTCSQVTGLIYKLNVPQIQCTLGDVNNDGQVNGLDSDCMVDIIFYGSGCENECTRYAADANCDGVIDILDYQIIVNAILNNQTIHCPGLSKTVANSDDPTAELSIAMVNGTPGTVASVPVRAANIDDLSAFSVEFRYDTEMLEFVGLNHSALTSSWHLLKAQELAPGVVKVIACNLEAETVTAQTDLFSLEFQVQENANGTSAIDIYDARLNQPLAKISHGSISTISAPVEFELSQNYPNPFNPSTEISFQMPSEGLVKITVYNAVGQQVKVLLDTILGTGKHSVRWNGTDESGIAMASGVYIYKMEAGNFISSKKMMLIK